MKPGEVELRKLIIIYPKLCAWRTFPNITINIFDSLIHFMETSKHGQASCLLTLWEGNPLVTYGLTSRWASDVELWWFLSCWPEQAVAQAVELWIIWDTVTLIRVWINVFLIAWTLNIYYSCFWYDMVVMVEQGSEFGPTNYNPYQVLMCKIYIINNE